MLNLPSHELVTSRKLIRLSIASHRGIKTMTSLGVAILFLALLATELFNLAQSSKHIFGCSFFGRMHLKFYIKERCSPISCPIRHSTQLVQQTVHGRSVHRVGRAWSLTSVYSFWNANRKTQQKKISMRRHWLWFGLGAALWPIRIQFPNYFV